MERAALVVEPLPRPSLNFPSTGKQDLGFLSFCPTLLPTRTILEKTADQFNISYSILTYYLNRHIELDGDEHGPMAISMLDKACGGSKNKEEEALQSARNSLQARLDLWNAICKQIEELK